MDASDIAILAGVATAASGAVTGVTRWLTKRTDLAEQLLKRLDEQKAETERLRQGVEAAQAESKDCLEKHRATLERDAQRTRAMRHLVQEVIATRRQVGRADDTGEHQLLALDAELRASTPVPEQPAALPRTVLIVDDDDGMLRMLARMIRQLGCTPIVAQGAQEAIGMLVDRDIDAMLVDVLMPQRSGIDLLLSVRQLAPKVPVVLMSGDSRLGAALARAEGVRFLAKPFEAEDLIAALTVGADDGPYR